MISYLTSAISMIHISIDPSRLSGRRLPFFLAIEEWVARRLPANDYFFSWQVDPTVICGRNQEITKEVDLEWCAGHGVDVVRRKSGGGAVFADRQNFMFSFITASDKVTDVFARYTDMIVEALRSLGFDAHASGRNDVLIGDRKVAGNAFYHIPGRSIAHGTMLYDFEPTCLANALTPAKAKLESKGVKSVPQRVTCLRQEGIRLSTDEFERYMIASITDGEPYILTDRDISEVEAIERNYYDPAFLKISADSNEHGDRTIRRKYIPGLGEFCISYRLDPSDNVIRDMAIAGDFFMSGDVGKRICGQLDGHSFNHDAISQTINSIDTESVIPGLTPDVLIEMIEG